MEKLQAIGAEISLLHPSEPRSRQPVGGRAAGGSPPPACGSGQQKQRSSGRAPMAMRRDPKRLLSLSQLLALEMPCPGDIFGAHLSPFITLPAPLPIIQLFIYSSKACLLWVGCGSFFLRSACWEQAETECQVKTNLESYGSHSNAWCLCSRQRAGTQSWIYALITESGLQEESHAKLWLSAPYRTLQIHRLFPLGLKFPLLNLSLNVIFCKKL